MYSATYLLLAQNMHNMRLIGDELAPDAPPHILEFVAIFLFL